MATTSRDSITTPSAFGGSQDSSIGTNSTLLGIATEDNTYGATPRVLQLPSPRRSPRIQRSPESPSYLINVPIVHTTSEAAQRENAVFALEDANEVGDGGDSDEEAEDADIHQDAMNEVTLERMADAIAADDDDQLYTENDSTALILHRGELTAAQAAALRLPSTPTNWVPPPVQVEKGEPEFAEVHNPGNWSQFTFRPEFTRGAYQRHSLPTGCTPVPLDEHGKYTVGEWEFHYNGWDAPPDNKFWSDANSNNLFPEFRKGSLNGQLLELMGLTKKRMKQVDALFFYQLILPICDPRRSGIRIDHRLPFYSDVESFSNAYAFQSGLGGSYGHQFKFLTLQELVHFDGVVVRDGVRGGSNGAIYRRWKEDCSDFDKDIVNAMTYHRFLQIKRVIKLCNNLGATMTCRRDRLPADIPGEYLHKKKTDNSDRSKAARFLSPVVCVKEKNVNGISYTRVHCSFQSTSSCNFSTVNALNSCKLSVKRKERGRGVSKRYWGIEMNDARQLYLGTYSRIDSIDHLIKNTCMFYRSWKYWHAPMLHAKALAVVVAYDMYLEVAEGELSEEWKVDNPVDFFTFRDKLSTQMLSYDPTLRKYPGDDKMRSATQQHAARRPGETVDPIAVRPVPRQSRAGPGRPTRPAPQIQQFVTSDQLESARTGAKSRLCGDLTKLNLHIESVQTSKKHPANCKVCGTSAYSMCMVCNVSLHFMPTRGEAAKRTCFFQWHDEMCFGLNLGDCAYIGKRKSEWVAPNRYQRIQNKKHIRDLNEELKLRETMQEDGTEEEKTEI